MAVVETAYGRVEGIRQHGIVVFRGIPFAQPPVGSKRWLAPQAPKPWVGIRPAKEFGPCAIQSTIPGAIGELIGIATGKTSEDCLYLNVWTPNCDGNKRPVMVWIHGGGNTVGSGSQPRVHGEHLARAGDMVIVTLNYRLGVLGFLHAPELGATGNEALLDQVAGLQWVKENIHVFGGDPNNVTVFGQSAGGFDIAQLMAMPMAAGSFDKAIPMSGSLTNQVTAHASKQTADTLANHCGGFDALREVPAERLLALQTQIPGARWAPTCDGDVIAEDAAVVLRRGDHTQGMPLMIGHTRDESTLFTIFNKEFDDMDTSTLRKLFQSALDDRADEAMHCYSEDRLSENLSEDPIDIWAAFSTDRMFRVPAIRTADAHHAHSANVWKYRFDWESPALEGRLHSCHSLDIPFVWGTYGLEQMQKFCGTDQAVGHLSENLLSSYVAFAHCGDPNHEGIPTWSTYTDKRTTMCFGATIKPVDDPMPATRKFWLQASK